MIHLFHPINYGFIVTLAAAVTFFVFEFFRLLFHQRRLHSIPIRIHVNGSRGKSSVTRLIGAVMRATGKTTIVKTTGTAARFILPDGHEIPIFRPGRPNIIEQFKVVRKAVELKAEVFVAECMAVTPEYIDILQSKMIQGNLGIMTNVRDDHLDVMGPTIYDAAINMSKSLPRNGHTITTENKWFSVLNTESQKRKSTIGFADSTSISDQELLGFSYIEHRENIALALEVAFRFGLSRERALQAMYKSNPDPGVLREIIIRKEKVNLYFFNALAANDPESSQVIWNLARHRRVGVGIIIMILRDDRVQRTESYFNYLGKTLCAEKYIIAGSQTTQLSNHLRKCGVTADQIVNLKNATAQSLLESLMQLACTDLVVCAMGNIIGLGEEFVKEILSKSHEGSE